MGKAFARKTQSRRVKVSEDSIDDLFTFRNNIKQPPTINIPPRSPVSPGNKQYLLRNGDRMMGALAFNPADVIIDATGHINIAPQGETNTALRDDTSYVLCTGAGTPDDLNWIDGAQFNGQWIILQGTASQVINIVHATTPGTNGNIVTTDGTDVVLDGTIATNAVPIATLIFDVTVAGGGSWRLAGGTGVGGGTGGEVFTWTADHDANGHALIEFRHADPADPTKQVKILNSGASGSTNTSLVFAQTLNSTLTFPSISAGTITYLERNQTWTGLNTFTPNGTLTGLNVGLKADPDPSAGANGDIYYNTTASKFRGFEAGAWTNISTGTGEVFTWSADHDANGKALIEFRHADPVDPTKQVKILNSGAAGATNTSLVFAQTLNSTLTFPDISAGTIPYLERSQTWTGINTFTPDTTFASINVGLFATDPSSGANGDLYFNTTDVKLKGFQGGWKELIGGVDNEVFTWSANHDANAKSLLDPRFGDPVSPTKSVRMTIDGATAGTTTTLDFNHGANRVITFPDNNGTLPLLETANTWTAIQTFTPGSTLAGLNVGLKADPEPSAGANGDVYYNTTDGKFRGFEAGAWTDLINTGSTSFADNVFDIHDEITPTQLLQFNLSSAVGGNLINISTTGARTWTFPDTTGTVMITSAVQTSTGNKTFDSTTSAIIITGTGAYINMNAHPIEFQDMAEADVGSVGTGERRLFGNTDNNSKLSVKRPDAEIIEVEGHRDGNVATATGAWNHLQPTSDFISIQPVGDTLYAIPWIPKEDCSLVGLGWYVIDNTGTTNADGLAGLYDNSPSTSPGNYPDTKLVQIAVQIDNSTLGAKTSSVTSTPVKGGHLYWIVYSQEDGTTEPQLTAYDGAAMRSDNIGLSTSEFINSHNPSWGYSVADTFSGTMTTPFPAAATGLIFSSDAPAVFVQVTVP